MKKAIISIIAIIAIVLISLTSFGKTPGKIILVQAQGKTIKLNTDDIRYLKSVCHNTTIVKALNTLTVIKNSDIADNVILIMNKKK